VHCYEYLRAEGKLFVIGFGGIMSTPGLVKFGWTKVVDFRHYFIPKVLCALGAGPAGPDDGITEVRSPEEIVPLLERHTDRLIQSVRDVRTYTWRISNPRYQYRIRAYRRSGGDIEGYVCYYVQTDKLFLFDFSFRTPRARRKLMGFLKRTVVRERLRGMVAFAAERSNVAAQLTGSGFVYNPFKKGPLHETYPFMFYADNAVMRELAPVKCWHVEAFDHDAL
jgi:hypothetical protein